MKVLARLAVLAAFALPTTIHAQVFYVGAGASVPVSDYSDYANTGVLAVLGVTYPVGTQGLNLVGEAFFGQNSHSDVDGDKTNPYGFMGGLEYDLTGDDDSKGVYFFGQAGILFHKYGSDTFEAGTDSGFGFGAGAGFFFPLGGITGWVEGRAMNASIDESKTSFLGFLAGIGIPFGGM